MSHSIPPFDIPFTKSTRDTLIFLFIPLLNFYLELLQVHTSSRTHNIILTIVYPLETEQKRKKFNAQLI